MGQNTRKKEITKPVNLLAWVDKSSPISEQYRTIRSNIRFSTIAGEQVKTLVITSSGAGEGKSTTAANLAVVFATSGQRVLLVDADMRKPTVHKTFKLNNAVGLSTVLTKQTVEAEALQSTMVDNLFVMTSGPKPPNPSELLGEASTTAVMADLRQQFDVVLFDMPPVVAVTDAQIMAAKADGTLIVVREQVTKKDSLRKAKSLLEMADANVLGVIYKGSKNAYDEGYYYYGA